ncbi:unnamed protein product [Ilex paraguariensis]|uniref:Uncharacterized protein n=1 Tax=Ilex paraguariensis TaxID=185542 RepID=A0ABC8U949_9AQUA
MVKQIVIADSFSDLLSLGDVFPVNCHFNHILLHNFSDHRSFCSPNNYFFFPFCPLGPHLHFTISVEEEKERLSRMELDYKQGTESHHTMVNIVPVFKHKSECF